MYVYMYISKSIDITTYISSRIIYCTMQEHTNQTEAEPAHHWVAGCLLPLLWLGPARLPSCFCLLLASIYLQARGT